MSDDTIHPEQHDSLLGPRLTWATQALAVAGGCLILGVAGLVTVSIGLRWLFGGGISGDFEIVQIATALTVFAFLPLCASRRGNIFVDALTTWMPQRVQRAIDALWDALFGLAALVIGWQLLQGATDTIRSNTVSMVLGLPTGWAIAACGIMAGLLAVIAFAVSTRLLRSSQ